MSLHSLDANILNEPFESNPARYSKRGYKAIAYHWVAGTFIATARRASYAFNPPHRHTRELEIQSTMWHFTDPNHAILVALNRQVRIYAWCIRQHYKTDHIETTERLVRAIRLSHTISQAITFLQRPVNCNGMSVIFNVQK